MKKIVLAAFTLVCICSACNNDKKEEGQEQKNIAASDAISKAFETGDVSSIDTYVTEDFVDHTDQGDKKGRDSLKAMVTMMHANFKDMKMAKVHEAAEGDMVFSWMKYTGTSDGAMGMPKGPFSMNAIEVAKFKDGKAVEHWSFVDMQDMMKMMPQQDMSHMNNMDNMKMDSSKMK